MKSRWTPSRTTLRNLFAVVTLASMYGTVFLNYSFPSLSDWLFWIFLLCLLPMFFLVFRALLRRRWKENAIVFVVGAVVFLPFTGVKEPLDWIRVQGFHLHISPLEEYLSRCELIEFIENGTKQTVGMCQSHGLYYGYAHTVIYDTTGELLKPVSHRTQAWQQAMSRFYSEEVLDSSEGRTQHIFGDFYEVGTSIAEERG